MKRLPVGIQSFEKLIDGNYLYIDKTAIVHHLVNDAGYYFLSRPRRFGKSLLLSTLKAVFQGKKELFKGLYIEDKWDWEATYPVIHISFAQLDYQGKGLEQALLDLLEKQAIKYEVKLKETTLKSRFSELISNLSKQNKITLLIDEYDKPLIDYLNKEDIHQAKAHQTILKNFYSVVKDSDQYLKFVFITGVSKFSQVSIFSDLNHLSDITFEWDFNTICGYTQEELMHYFAPYLPKALARNNLQEEALLEKIKTWYNGYSWDGVTRVYNSFSILRFFKSGQFENYWFTTGTPTFLIKLLKERSLYDFGEVITSKLAVESYNLDNLDTVPLLLQTGYLTIKSIKGNRLALGYPNLEVKEAMQEHLLAGFSHNVLSSSSSILEKVHTAFEQNNIAEVIRQINLVFSTIPNLIFQAKKESYYQSLIHITFTYLGIYLQSEVNTSRGRCDTVVYTDTHIYLLEFKLDKPVKEALEQINDRAYTDTFKAQHPSKKIVKVGISFDSSKKEVGDWKVVTDH